MPMVYLAIGCSLGLHVLSISILFHANLVSFTALLAKAGATGAETQVLRGMDFFVWCLSGTECFGRMALIGETGDWLQLGTCSPSSLQLIPSPWPEMRYQFITCTGMRSAPQTGGNCTIPNHQQSALGTLGSGALKGTGQIPTPTTLIASSESVSADSSLKQKF